MSRSKFDLVFRAERRHERNTAGSKAVLDCSRLLGLRGYRLHRIQVEDDTSWTSLGTRIRALGQLVRLISALPRDAIVSVQYPLPVSMLKMQVFIRLARIRGVRLFCIVHDVPSLRSTPSDRSATRREAAVLNDFDHVIVHNPRMLDWLRSHGTSKPMTSIGLFDYLAPEPVDSTRRRSGTIVFAGNLVKSPFVERLGSIRRWRFGLYGPGYEHLEHRPPNVRWRGEYTPEDVVAALDGDFGLIWDGPSIDECGDVLGHYLRYNNPHKLSLYVAAGLPVIVPANAAVASIVRELGIGVVVESLRDLDGLRIEPARYEAMRTATVRLGRRVAQGEFMLRAVDEVEASLG